MCEQSDKYFYCVYRSPAAHTVIKPCSIMSLMTAGNLLHLSKSTLEVKMSCCTQAYRMLTDATELQRKIVNDTKHDRKLKTFIYI